MPIKTEPKGPKPPLPGLVKLTFSYQNTINTALSAQNILHGKWADSTNHDAADLAALVTAAGPSWIAEIMPLLSNAVKFTNLTVQSLGGDGGESGTTESTSGSEGGAFLPPQCAAVISWKANITFRGGRPRTYVPGASSNWMHAAGDSGLNPTFSSALATAALSFMSTMNAVTGSGSAFALGVPSYFSKGAFRPTPVFFPFTGAVVHDRLDSQRRRSGKERLFPID